MKQRIESLYLFSLLFVLSCTGLPPNHGAVEYKLFLADNAKRPMVVAFGGSEGGMIYAGAETGALRDSIISMGYHFLAIGYFGMPNTPKDLDRIALDAIYDTIKNVSQQPFIDQERMAIFGGSRGGELVLNLACRYEEIDAVVAIVPANVTLPSRFGWNETSSWTFQQEEIPWITGNKESIELIKKGDFYEGLRLMIETKQSIQKFEIPVEDMSAAILFISAIDDEVWPSTLMCNRMTRRLEEHDYQYFYHHIKLKGGHAAFVNNYRPILAFLKEHFPVESQ